MKQDKYKPYVVAGLTGFLALAAAILLFFFLSHITVVLNFLGTVLRIMRPILMGIVIAFLLLPVYQFAFDALLVIRLNKPKSRRFVKLCSLVAVLMSLIFAVFLLYLFLYAIVPQIYGSVVGLVGLFPYYAENVQNFLFGFVENNPNIQATLIPLYDSAVKSIEEWIVQDIMPNLATVETTVTWIKESVLPQLPGVVTGVSGFVYGTIKFAMDVLVAVIAAVYILMSKDVFAAQGKKIAYSMFSVKGGDFIVDTSRDAYRIMSGFVNGKLLDSLIIGILALLCCNLLHYPHATLLATIIGVTNVIPFFGPFIGAIPCAILLLLIDPLKCISFVIFILILQQFDGNILGPKILGDSTGLDSFWVLFSILLFGGVFGFAGMVLGVPVFAILFSLGKRAVYHGLRKRNLPVDTEWYMGKTELLSKNEDVADRRKSELL